MRNITGCSLGLCSLAAILLVGCGKGAVPADADHTIGSDTDESGDVTTPVDKAAELLPLNVLDDKYRTTYEIFVYSFCDSNGDGIGDLDGVTKMLDYINDGDDTTDTDLGCNEIWLMPVAPSTTYHKYDVTDYCDIDPEYGTLEDFDELVSACHDRGIRVIVDTVFNHSSDEHKWFTEAAEYLKEHPGITFEDGDYSASFYIDCPKLSYYIFSNEKKDGYEPLSGTDYYYEARFWSKMPDLNLDSSSVRDELSRITQFWTDHGVDGFRLDATTYYYTGDDTRNIEFMTWLNDTVKSQNKDAYIVGEAWTSSATYSKYYESGIDSFFDFDFAGSEGVIAGVARGTTPASRYGEALVKNQELLDSVSTDAIDAPFYTNHDMARSAGYFTGKGSEDKMKLSAALNLLMPGNAFIYYGEELGMKGSGKDENKRAPMYWTAGAGADGGDSPSWLSDAADGMCKGPKAMDRFDMKYPALDEQMADPYSIYNYYKAAIRLRNTYPVIARGETKVVDALSGKNISAFIRYTSEEAAAQYLQNAKNGTASAEGAGAVTDFGPLNLLVVVNTADEEKTVDLSGVDMSLLSGASANANGAGNSGGTGNADGAIGLAYQLNTSEAASSLDGTSLTVAPYGVVVLTQED